MEEVVEILRLFDKECDRKLPKIHLVFGKYAGPLDVSYGEKVVFVGDCCEWEGKVGAELVQITNIYKDRTKLDPYEARHKDVYAQILRMARKLREAKERPYIRLEGCPVSIGDLALLLAELGGIKNPYFDKRQIVNFNRAYVGWRSVQAFKRMLGERYQVHGPTARGEARPTLPADTPDAEE
jgi:hypothetical protein